MKTHWIDDTITYDGTQLRSCWITEQTGQTGDAIAAFVGPADVPIENMVDLDDVAANAPIYSPLMLHLLIEHAGADIALGVARQRLLTAIIAELLHESGATDLVRRGDDLFDGERKLSVSIATTSAQDTLIHFALNIECEGTPVPTQGLAHYGIDPQQLGEAIMRRYAEEIAQMAHACTKVRSVP